MSAETPLWPAGVGRLVLEEIDSTNAEALRRAAKGEDGPLWILARRQTAGRGRRGRAWSDPAGNFAASLLFPPGGDIAHAPLRGFVAGLALLDALSALAALDAGRLRLKWPNDLLLDGGKLAGILVEGAGQGRLIVGIGVNLTAAPDPQPGAAFAPVALASACPPPAPETLLAHLAPAFARREAQLLAEGFGALRADWLARAAGIGGPILARLPDREVAGIFETLDPTGALILRRPDGVAEVIAAGDIHLSGQPA